MLAVIGGLVVSVGKEWYIIPLARIRERFRPASGMVTTMEGKAEVTVRGHLLPLLRLYKRFGIQPGTQNPCDGVLVVAEVDETSFCLLVDELVGKQEVVIKSLSPVFQEVSGIAGGAIPEMAGLD